MLDHKYSRKSGRLVVQLPGFQLRLQSPASENRKTIEMIVLSPLQLTRLEDAV